MKFINTLFFVILISSVSININAEETYIGDVSMGKIEQSAAFVQMKRMLGKWEGKLYQQSGAVVDTSSEFRLVSNGNSIVETLIEDGVEMFTTYSDKDGELVIKHYCALGTEPMFTVASIDANSIQLKSDPTPGYHPEHHNFVKSMGWTFNSTDDVRVDASLHIDGEVQIQHSMIKKVY